MDNRIAMLNYMNDWFTDQRDNDDVVYWENGKKMGTAKESTEKLCEETIGVIKEPPNYT